jgi:DNA repair protein RadC
VHEFGSLARVLAAGDGLNRIVDDPGAVALIGNMQMAMVRALRAAIESGPVFENVAALYDYARGLAAHGPTERLHVLYLDMKNRLITDEVASVGCIAEVATYPRQIMRRALELGATGLILIHNHPSGDPTPSANDTEQTARVRAAGEVLGIVLHDHLVVGSGGMISMRAARLL